MPRTVSASKNSRTPNIRIVLVRPRNPLNIGAAARAMANFGLHDLAVVQPYEKAWQDARSALRGEPVLRSARQFPSIAKAVADCTLVIGTSSLERQQVDLPVISLDRFLAPTGKIAILFGSEKTGLNLKEMDFCHAILTIPTRPNCPSMNLGQAVAVVAYELKRGAPLPLRERARVRGQIESSVTLIPTFSLQGRRGLPMTPEPCPVTQKEIDALVRRSDEYFTRTNYRPELPRAKRNAQFRKALMRWNLTSFDVKMLHSVFKWRKRGF